MKLLTVAYNDIHKICVCYFSFGKPINRVSKGIEYWKIIICSYVGFFVASCVLLTELFELLVVTGLVVWLSSTS